MASLQITMIKEQIDRLEKEERIQILYACESGSRAWGFHSRDSDYDVRFIYVREPDWYLSIYDKRDVIERPISDQLDISGWDLRKALNLYRKSNPPLLEWLQSPIQYAEKFSTAEQLREIAELAFSPKSTMYHYLHMARGNYREYLQGEQVRIKKYFYALRPILACEWIERFGEMPPIEFDRLVEHLIHPSSELSDQIERLLARKKQGDELDYEPRLNPINEYLEDRILYFEQTAGSLRSTENNIGDRLDDLFRASLKEAWV